MSVINREDTINYLMTNMNWHDEDGYTVENADEKRAIITDLINGVPDADDGWIPCSKRLPEKNGFYLVTLNNSRTVFCLWNEDKKGFGMLGTKWYPCEEVTAWMPLPEPYEQKEKKQ